MRKQDTHWPTLAEALKWDKVPEKVGTVRRLKSDTDETYLQKVLDRLREREALDRSRAQAIEAKRQQAIRKENQRRAERIEKLLGKRLDALDSETLVNLEARFFVSADRAKAKFLTLVDGVPPLIAAQYQSMRGNRERTFPRVHDVMAHWVSETAVVKSSEARCNLECGQCPHLKALACATTNLSPLNAWYASVEAPYGLSDSAEAVFDYLTARPRRNHD